VVNPGVNGNTSMILVQANEWVNCAALCAVTGFSPGKVRSYRQRGWRQGKEWILVSCNGTPCDNSEALYNLPAINKWFARQAANQPSR